MVFCPWISFLWQKKTRSINIPLKSLKFTLPSLHFQITFQLFTKFLGLTFHSNASWTLFTWKSWKLNASTQSISLNIYLTLVLDVIADSSCNYNSLIRSQLDYGAPIYSHANNTALKLLDSIQSAALRLALGALHTSSTLSLCAEAGVLPLQFRFLSLTTDYLASTVQFS